MKIGRPVVFLAILAIATGCQTADPSDPAVGAPESVQPVTTSMEPAPSPEFTVGDQYVWIENDGSENAYDVVAVEGERVTWESTDGWRWVDVGLITPSVSWTGPGESGSHSLSGSMQTLFPLQVGNTGRVSYTGVSNGEPFSGGRSCTVTEEERITVPLGTFDSFKIVCRQGRDLQNPSQVRVYHYAPEIAHLIRIFRQRGSNSPEISELLAFSLAEDGATEDAASDLGGDS